MRVVPERSPWLQLLTILGGFTLGPLAALRLSMAVAPDSGALQIVSVLGFGLVFAGGTVLWMGLGIVTVVLAGLWKLARGRRPGPEGGLGKDERLVPMGYRSFVVLGGLSGIAMGLFAGLLTSLTVLTATAIWTASGLAYGALLWAAAHHGYFPFPEPE